MARRVLWAVFAFTTLLYGILAYATERNFTLQPFSGALRRPIVVALYVIAVALFIAAIALERKRGTLAPPAVAEESMERFAVRLAILEAVALLGLCAAFVIHDWRLYLPAWALSLAGLARSFPAPSSNPR